MPKAGVYLVFDNSYQLLGVASGDRASYTKYADQCIRVVGPVEVDSPIDWGNVEEERYGKYESNTMQYITMKDGVPDPLVNTGLYRELGVVK